MHVKSTLTHVLLAVFLFVGAQFDLARIECERGHSSTNWSTQKTGIESVPQLAEYATERNTWRGITPLSSGRIEVERLLGSPSNSLRNTYIYEAKFDKVHVLYSGSACEDTEVGSWNVPKDTVLKVSVYPQEIVLIKDLKLADCRFERVHDVHPEDWVHYIDRNNGITVNALSKGGREEVMSVVYEPSSNQKTLRCVAPSKQRSQKP